MLSIKSYILSVVVVSVISGVISAFISKKGTGTALMKMMVGLFVLITVISPWTKIRFENISDAITINKQDANGIIADGSRYSEEMIKTGITSRAEAYILDKAESLGLDISVTVFLSGSPPYSPESVEIAGYASPYNKKRIQTVIADDLGICEECQIWI